MHVEEDEQVGGAVALILAVVALQLPRLGLDGLANLADELGRAFVETDHRTLPIGLRSIEVEHIFHAGDELAVDLRDAPHVLAPGLELVFRQAPAHGLARDGGVPGEPDQLIGQQFQRPAGATLGRVRTGRRDQQGLLLAGELAVRSRARLFTERRLQIANHEAALGPIDGRAADLDAPRDLLVADAGIRSQQNLRTLELARRVPAAAEERPELIAFRLAELDPIAYIHPCLPPLGRWRHRSAAESDGRGESCRKNLHAHAGPVLGIYPPVHAPASPAAGGSRHPALFSRHTAFRSPDGAHP